MATAADDALLTAPDADETGATDAVAVAESVIADGAALVTGETVRLAVAR
jgi:hypothetical protein